MSSQLLGISTLEEDPTPIVLGPPTENLDALLGLAETIATGHDNLIVTIKGPALQKWKDA